MFPLPTEIEISESELVIENVHFVLEVHQSLKMLKNLYLKN